MFLDASPKNKLSIVALFSAQKTFLDLFLLELCSNFYCIVFFFY